jgi:glycosyltransferase involved in cell wall biosynthesis
MRVLHVIDSLVLGGAEVLVKDLAPRMRARGVDFQVLELLRTDSPVEVAVRDSEVPVHNTGVGSLYSPRQINAVAEYVDSYDIVHVQLFPAQLWAAAAFAIRRRTSHLITTEQNTWNYRRDHWWLRPLDAWMYRQYELIACNSEGTAAELRRWCPSTADKLRIVDNGIPVEQFETANPAELDVFLVPGLTRLAFVARMYPQKDHATLLRAMSKLPDAQLVLVGDGPLRRQLQEMAQRLGIANRVAFLGHRTDVAQVLKACDIYVHSTNSDGFGIAACEAMAAGLPVVVSDVPGLAEVVEGAGIVFPKGDDDALARELRVLIASPDRRRHMSRASSERARHFSIDRIVDEYIDLYQSALRRPPL